MIDFNLSEIVVLAVLAVIIFGPEKLPEVARKAARVLNYLRTIANDARGQLRQELGPEFDDIHLSDLNPKNFVAKHMLGDETTRELRETAEEVRALTRGVMDDDAEVPAGDLSDGSRIVAFDPEST